MRLILIFTLLISLAGVSRAQLSGIPPVGPVSNGLGGISSTFDNAWSIFNNPAGLTGNDELVGVFGYQTIFNFAPFNTVAAAVTSPTKIGTVSFGTYRFGDNIFSSQMGSLGIAKTLGIMSLGIKANYLQYNIQGFGRRSVFVAEMGGLATLTDNLRFGMHIYNFTQSIIAEESGEKLPTLLRLSLQYKVNEEIDFYVEGEKDVEQDPDLKVGLSYNLNGMVVLRTGFSTLTNRHSLGVGVEIKKFTIDYALKANSNIGSAHNFGLTYRFK